ncbi:phosphoenolpyruvate--protein phosphotransferase [Haliangium ochraceum]|uniref:Phosphoenolpyruvate-protein phosphotransferase n=1 Tax=Haliangium ochraceum (strain DSM 14365 / JCM 11303 / SMP-2) TaxID=502025 RepID=D0LNB2_HALO1|nr:phosphoenolpyruvate--protein phosphotransferase [Haliangium ochraceum]ACY15289.1 phosphoenolpyruvate-protein phosphotransferase [Haliangium ochraceum DSM 14365]
MEANRKLRKRGTPASSGIGIGRAYLVDRRRLKIPKRNVSEDQVEDEVVRLHAALEASDRQFDRIKQKLQKRTEGGDHHNIIAAYQLILHDEHLVDEAIRLIREDQINAEWALHRTVEHIQGVFEAIEDDYFRERRSDVGFVGERVLRNLLGREIGPVKPPPDAIVVAHDLSPADTAQLHRAAVAGLVTDVGGKTSHTAIIARAHEIPAVIGLDDITAVVETGDLIIVDGSMGEVFINPDAQTVAEYRELAHKEAAFGAALLSNRDLPADTADGISIELLSNVDHTDEVQSALNHGATGVGLFRTEFLFMAGGEDDIPDEDEQYEVFRGIVEILDGRKATIRTFDLGADKMSQLLGARHQEANPALGLRSIRLCLTESVRPLFKTQLRALLRASVHGPLRIMFPMISGLDELRMARAVLDEATEELRAEGVAFDPEVEVGIMIEVPSTAMVADLLAPEVDFFSIGTNDLIQYALAVDRVNEHVSYLYQPLHPCMLRLIRMVCDAARAHDVSVSICGEMAGDPVVVPVLLGLGLRELSMNAVAIPEVKNIIRSCRQSDLDALIDGVTSLGTISEVRAAVRDYFLSANIEAAKLL